MKKSLFKCITIFIIISSLFCGCGTKTASVQAKQNKQTNIERPSQYAENEKPWGESNHKGIGIIKNLEKNLKNNYITADFFEEGQTTQDKVKIYGTDMKISDYEGKKVFISGFSDISVEDGFILLSTYHQVNLIKDNIGDKINSVSSADDTQNLNEISNEINGIKNAEYRDYIRGTYNNKIDKLKVEKQKKQEEQNQLEEQKRIAEQKRQEEFQKQEEAQKQKQQEQQTQQAVTESNSSNAANNGPTESETVYVAASGNGKKYHSSPNCSRMKGNVNSMSRSAAESAGYGACKKCYR